MTTVKTLSDGVTPVTNHAQYPLTSVRTRRNITCPMYRPPSRAPKGAWANHLHAIRRERDLSQTQAFELVYEGLGISPKSRAVYLAIDMGDRQPSKTEAEYLASVFGWPSEAVEPPVTPDTLAAAINRQAAALEALVARLDGDWSDRLAKIEQEVGLLLPLLGHEGSQERLARRGTTG